MSIDSGAKSVIFVYFALYFGQIQHVDVVIVEKFEFFERYYLEFAAVRERNEIFGFASRGVAVGKLDERNFFQLHIIVERFLLHGGVRSFHLRVGEFIAEYGHGDVHNGDFSDEFWHEAHHFIALKGARSDDVAAVIIDGGTGVCAQNFTEYHGCDVRKHDEHYRDYKHVHDAGKTGHEHA